MNKELKIWHIAKRDGALTPLGEALQMPCPRCSQRWIIHDCPIVGGGISPRVNASEVIKPVDEIINKPNNKRSKYWDTMVDILDKQFPKNECEERGKALVMLAHIEMMLQGVAFVNGEPIKK